MHQTFVCTPEQHVHALRLINSYISSTARDVDARPRAHAIYAIHPPNTPVRGTVVLFHGLGSTPEIMRPTMHYLHSASFNVYAPPSPGHAYNPTRQPSVTIPPPLADVARAAILADTQLAEYFRQIEEHPTMRPIDIHYYTQMVTRLEDIVKRSLSADDASLLLDTLRLLSGGNEYDPHLSTTLGRVCNTDHYRWESHPLERLAEVAPLPGPTHIIGFSMGGLQAVNVASHAPYVDKTVLLAPFFGFPTTKDYPSIHLDALGALDLFTLPFPISTVYGRALTACTIAARMAYREEINKPLRANGSIFCVLSEGDDSCDITLNKQFFHDRLENERSRLFIYPKETDLLHNIVPNSENKWSAQLLQEIFRFLTTGQVETDRMLRSDTDDSLPPVDNARLTITL